MAREVAQLSLDLFRDDEAAAAEHRGAVDRAYRPGAGDLTLIGGGCLRLVGTRLRAHRLEHQRVEISAHLHNCYIRVERRQRRNLAVGAGPQFQDTMRMLAAVLQPMSKAIWVEGFACSIIPVKPRGSTGP